MTRVIIAAVAAAVVGLIGGLAVGRSGTGRRQTGQSRPRWSASKLIAFGVLFVDGSATYIVLYLCYLSIRLQFSGSLPYLTTLIGALQAASGYVLGHYFKKSTAENTAGGITYDAAFHNNAAQDCDDITQ